MATVIPLELESFHLSYLCIVPLVFQRMFKGIKAHVSLETINVCGFGLHGSVIFLAWKVLAIGREEVDAEKQGKPQSR